MRSAGDEVLLEAIEALERSESLAALTRARMLAELEARGVTDRVEGLKTAPWVARQVDRNPAAVGAEVNLGRALRDWFPDVDAAVAAGRLSIDHARVLVSVANRRNRDGLAAMQQRLIAYAADRGFAVWREHVRLVADLLDHDGPHDPNADLARNRLRLSQGLHGDGHVEVTITADNWPSFKQPLNDKADELFRRYHHLHDLDPTIAIPDRGTLLSLALQELVHLGQGIDLDSTRGPRIEATFLLHPTDLSPTTNTGREGDDGGNNDGGDGEDMDDEENVDGGDNGAGDDKTDDRDGGDDGGGRGDGGDGGHDRYGRHDSDGEGDRNGEDLDGSDDDRDALAGAASAARPGPHRGGRDRSATLTDADGLPLLASVLAWFLCDADVYHVIVDSLGVPIDLGTRVRRTNRAQRRAVRARDDGCAFAGCDRPANWCDHHHIHHHQHGGTTSIANSLLLCRFHHGVVHRHGWSVHTTGDGWCWFQTPTGRTHWSQRHFKRRTDPPPPPTITIAATAKAA